MDLSHVHCSCHQLFELSDHDRAMSCLKDFFVPHPSAERLFKKMDMIMSMPRKVVAPCLLCLGKGGVGKLLPPVAGEEDRGRDSQVAGGIPGLDRHTRQ